MDIGQEQPGEHTVEVQFWAEEKTLSVTSREIQHQLVLGYLHHRAKVSTMLGAVPRVLSVAEMNLVLSLTPRDAVCPCLCNEVRQLMEGTPMCPNPQPMAPC